MIIIVDYDAGNIGSVANICRKAGGKAKLSADPGEIAAADKLILPGVGHFGRSRDRLAAMGVDAALETAVRERRVPLLGICLGMQLLTRSSTEGDAEGFGWIDAHTVRFSFPAEDRRKVPHMGWNRLIPARPDPLLAGLDDEARFYFVHSYYVVADDPAQVLARADYGGEFVAAVQHDNIWGMQFHPEKSHRFGLTVMRNFVALPSGAALTAAA
jgi:imidazole glycerol-phosphate synthase subunit HisH